MPPDPEPDNDPNAWKAGLPEEMQTWPEVKDAESVEAFHTYVGEQRSRLGRSLSIPTEEAGDEQWAEFYGKVAERANGRLTAIPGDDSPEAVTAAFRKATGVPEVPEEYEFPEGDDIPIVADERKGLLRALAHKHGLSKKQMTGMAADILKADGEVLATQNSEVAQGTAQIQTEWGDAYDQRMSRLGKFLELTKGPEALLKAVQNKSIGPSSAKWLYSLVESLGGETAELVLQEGGAVNKDTVSDAKAKLDDIYEQDGREGRKLHAYFDEGHPGHQQAIQTVINLTKASGKSNEGTFHVGG